MSSPVYKETVDKFWLSDIYVLFDPSKAQDFFPNSSQTDEERMNALSRMSIYSGVLLSLYHRNSNKMILSVIGLITSAVIYKNTRSSKERLTILKKVSTVKPTLNNPFMNPDMTSPASKTAAPTYFEDTGDAKELREDITDKFGYNLYKDVDDVYNKNGMRQFYTVPNTENPSNQEKFIKFLYGDNNNCKTTKSQCEPYSDLRSNPAIFPNPLENPKKIDK